jgi:hypothetical protein
MRASTILRNSALKVNGGTLIWFTLGVTWLTS